MLQAHYINGKFTFEDQNRLAEKLMQISNRKNVKWMMTNTAHEDVCKLYEDYNIHQIPRGVSSVIGVHTFNSHEVVISNY